MQYRGKNFRLRRRSDVILDTITIQLELCVVDTFGLVAVRVDPADVSLQLKGSFWTKNCCFVPKLPQQFYRTSRWSTLANLWTPFFSNRWRVRASIPHRTPRRSPPSSAFHLFLTVRVKRWLLILCHLSKWFYTCYKCTSCLWCRPLHNICLLTLQRTDYNTSGIRNIYRREVMRYPALLIDGFPWESNANQKATPAVYCLF